MGTERQGFWLRFRLARSIPYRRNGVGILDKDGIAGNEVHHAVRSGWRASNAFENFISLPTKKDLLDGAMKNALDGPRATA